jgi:hypothetical protein
MEVWVLDAGIIPCLQAASVANALMRGERRTSYPGPDSKSRTIASISLQQGSLLVAGRAERGGPQVSTSREVACPFGSSLKFFLKEVRRTRQGKAFAPHRGAWQALSPVPPALTRLPRVSAPVVPLAPMRSAAYFKSSDLSRHFPVRTVLQYVHSASNQTSKEKKERIGSGLRRGRYRIWPELHTRKVYNRCARRRCPPWRPMHPGCACSTQKRLISSRKASRRYGRPVSVRFGHCTVSLSGMSTGREGSACGGRPLRSRFVQAG